jgi:hypothetical protein
MERVCVKLNETEQQGVIKEINPDKSAVVEFDDKSTKTVRISEMEMVAPVEHDTVLVARGTEIGLEGALVCVDGRLNMHACILYIYFFTCIHIYNFFKHNIITGSDAILRDAQEEFKIIDFVHLVKIFAES